MHTNLSEILRHQDIHETPWWTGAIQICERQEIDPNIVRIAPAHVYVLPVDDSQDHFVGECACNPDREFTGQGFRLIVTHNAFDGRE